MSVSFGIDKRDELNFRTRRVGAGITNWDIRVGQWVALGRNGLAYPIDHTPVLPEDVPGEDGTRPDALASVGLVLKGTNLGIANGCKPTLDIITQEGATVVLNKKALSGTVVALEAAQLLTIVDSGADIGLLIPAGGSKGVAIVKTVDKASDTFTVELAIDAGVVVAASSGADDDRVVISPDLDTNLDGVVTAKEILDVDNDGDTDIHDIIEVIHDNVND